MGTKSRKFLPLKYSKNISSAKMTTCLGLFRKNWQFISKKSSSAPLKKKITVFIIKISRIFHKNCYKFGKNYPKFSLSKEMWMYFFENNVTITTKSTIVLLKSYSKAFFLTPKLKKMFFLEIYGNFNKSFKKAFQSTEKEV